MCTLGDLKPGQQARLVGFSGGSSAYRRRLLSMGLTPGTVLTMERFAPFGDPVLLRVRHFLLSLRKAEAAILQLERLPI